MSDMRTVDISCKPDEINNENLLSQKIRSAAGKEKYKSYKLVRRWIDARRRVPRFGLRYQLLKGGQESSRKRIGYEHVSPEAITIHIIGAGPAGYFAALRALRHGLRPIVIEQGVDVRARRRDLKAIQQDGVVNDKSNYCFGEGGAGTYSDGKLYTRSKKRGDIDAILSVLIDHGANPEIAIDAHPHIGSNKLPGIIANMRQTIENHGGEVRFATEVTDIIADHGRVTAIEVNGDEEISVERLILATGHSARPIYEMFHKKNWKIEAKPFALGVRVEHPQSLIDKIQYNHAPRHENLPAAAYRLACEIDERGVFSFCMCPGGLIVPAATSPGELVVNGMSLSKRDSAYANSGFVVAVQPSDLTDDVDADPMVCLDFQRKIEQLMFAQGDGSQAAPAQRIRDFMKGQASEDLPPTSYIPGIYPSRLDELLPDFIVERMRQGLKKFDRRLKGMYIEGMAVMVGVESRTSSPIKIPRDGATMEHVEIKGLYPCAEGAGYAGGIMSAALDGQRIIETIVKSLG